MLIICSVGQVLFCTEGNNALKRASLTRSRCRGKKAAIECAALAIENSPQSISTSETSDFTVASRPIAAFVPRQRLRGHPYRRKSAISSSHCPSKGGNPPILAVKLCRFFPTGLVMSALCPSWPVACNERERSAVRAARHNKSLQVQEGSRFRYRPSQME